MDLIGNGLGPQGISAVVLLGALLVGGLAGALALGLGQLGFRGGRPSPPLLIAAGLLGTGVAVALFVAAWWLLDDTARPVNNPGLLIAALAGALAALLVAAPRLDVPRRLALPAALPFALLVLLVLAGSGLAINGWREAAGFARGAEPLHRFARLAPKGALATPSSAIQYYNEQLAAVSTAADGAIDGVLAAQSTDDVAWFLDNAGFLLPAASSASAADPVAVARPGRKSALDLALAITRFARPVFGRPAEEKILGKDALVRTDAGQVVRLTKEGPLWKISGWLGHRYAMMEEIHPAKKEKGAATAADDAQAAGGWSRFEAETEALAKRAGLAWRPTADFGEFDPIDPKLPAPRPSTIRRPSPTGYAQLDSAPPGALVDLSNAPRADSVEVPRVAGAAQPATAENASLTPGPSPAPEVAVSTEAGQPAAPLTTSSASAATPAPVLALPTPALPEGAPPVPTPMLPAPPAVALVPGAQTPLPAILPPAEILPITPGTPLIAGLFPGPGGDQRQIADFWPRYFEAVEGVLRNDLPSLARLTVLFSLDDREWLQRNALILCLMITPEAINWNEQRQQLVAAQILLRNMPRTPIPPERIRVFAADSTAIVRMVHRQEGAPDQVFSTLMTVERGRWVLVHPFWVRTSVWTPQIAEAKRAMGGLPLSIEESAAIQGGARPMQQFLRPIFDRLGYQPE